MKDVLCEMRIILAEIQQSLCNDQNVNKSSLWQVSCPSDFPVSCWLYILHLYHPPFRSCIFYHSGQAVVNAAQVINPSCPHLEFQSINSNVINCSSESTTVIWILSPLTYTSISITPLSPFFLTQKSSRFQFF